jgi:phage terminase large subunit
MVDKEGKRIFVFDEFYQKGMSNEAIAKKITEMGYSKERITADSSEPKSIDELERLGLRRIRKARKGADSVNHGIQAIRDFKIIVNPACVNFITEISNYTWDADKFGGLINKPVDDFNHLMDAMRYAFEDITRGKTFDWA